MVQLKGRVEKENGKSLGKGVNAYQELERMLGYWRDTIVPLGFHIDRIRGD